MKCTAGTGAALSVAFVALLSGCGDGENGIASTQVVAKVNDDEITVHQLNFELARLQPARQADVKNDGKVVLDQLVNQQLLVQKAIENKLDRDPQVLRNMERAKRLVLAQAYAQRVFENSTPPAENAIETYYHEHPELFAKRRVYQLQEVLVSSDYPVDKLKSELEQAESLKVLVEKLQEQGVPLRVATSVKPAEQLPFEVLNKIAAMEQGQATTYSSPQGLLVLHVAGVRETPVSQEQAAPMIKRYLLAQQRKETINQEVERLRTAANIEYTGMFAESAGSTPSTLAVPNDISGGETGGETFLNKGPNGLK